MLDVSHLTKEYGPLRAVDDISFTSRKGEILGFLGPNGAGKTTTMRMITGYLPPTAGEVRIDGISLHDNALEAKRRVGYLPEAPPVYPELSVRDYLMFVAQLKQIPSRQRKAAIDKACERAALSDHRHRIIGRLSKGYRQRVGIAQAIINEPSLLILDEPTAGLDPRQILETRELIRTFAGEHTVILSTHILSEAANTCERVIIIHRGKLVAADTPENLMHVLKSTDTLVAEVRGPADRIQAAVGAIPGVVRVTASNARGDQVRLEIETSGDDVRESIARTVVSAGWGLLELHAVELSLEDIFLSLTGPQRSALAASGHGGNGGVPAESQAATQAAALRER